jgi:hypothetical protein
MAEVLHCEGCRAEYVAGVPSCADCRGSLTPGALPRANPPREAARSEANPESEVVAVDAFLLTAAGAQAEIFATALNMEGVTCLLECQGIRQWRRPSQKSGTALASTLPVSLYVARADQERAREVVTSLSSEDLVGEQWAEDPSLQGDRFTDTEGGPERCEQAALARPALSNEAAPRPESAAGRMLGVVALAVAAIVLGSQC